MKSFRFLIMHANSSFPQYENDFGATIKAVLIDAETEEQAKNDLEKRYEKFSLVNFGIIPGNAVLTNQGATR